MNTRIHRPRIVIIFTGGTIASTLDAAFGGVVPSLTGGEILQLVPDIQHVADVTVHEYGAYPGPHITPERMAELAVLIRSYREQGFDGAVVTHGTDTLEETAYFLDLTVGGSMPVVVVGSMRNSSEPDWDGPRNLRDAVAVAAHPSAKDHGVLVCLGGEILAASEATKVDTADVATFASPNFGPVGRITNRTVLMHRQPLRRETIAIGPLPPFVPLFKLYAGMNGTLIDAAVDLGAQGVVVEAFGVGNVTPAVFSALCRVMEHGLPVVLVSRCPVGRVEHVYAYEGAGKVLYEAGVIFADYLNGPKARIKLLCLLAAGSSLDDIRASFEWVEHEEGPL